MPHKIIAADGSERDYKLPLPNGTDVVYDSYPDGVDFEGLIVEGFIYAFGRSKVDLLDLGVATSIEVERAENIRVILLGDTAPGEVD